MHSRTHALTLTNTGTRTIAKNLHKRPPSWKEVRARFTRDCVCEGVCVCVAVLREAHTKKAPGLITLLSVPSMPAAFRMTHGPHAHGDGSCSPAAVVQQSAAAAHAIAIRACVPYTRQYTV